MLRFPVTMVMVVVVAAQQLSSFDVLGGVDDGAWLQQLYLGTNGAGWNDTFGGQPSCNGGWNMTPGANPCNGPTSLWTSRVECNDNGRVIGVHFSSCNLSGTLPELNRRSRAMFELQQAHLSSNQLTGPLPQSWSGLVDLDALHLNDNHIQGELPSSWSKLSSLRILDLSENSLAGSIPSAWSKLSRLQQLTLNDNLLTGTLPSTLGSLYQLVTMSFNENRLSGQLPKELSQLSNLTKMSFDNNAFNGSLPESWASLSNLENVSAHSIISLELFRHHGPTCSDCRKWYFTEIASVVRFLQIGPHLHLFLSFHYQ